VALGSGLLVWEFTPLSGWYHSLLGTVATSIYQARHDPVVHDIVHRHEDLIAHVWVGGSRQTLHVGASDITGNIAVLVALVIGSGLSKTRHWLLMMGALFLLAVSHLVALHVLIRAAVAPVVTPAWSIVSWLDPLAFLLWTPCLLARRPRPSTEQVGITCRRESKRQRRDSGSLRSRVG